ncbi:MAG: hypothetical protein QOI58_2199 [Thermoanaerobaculia bacterium]|nr:hypothetical protein [Thermoanaerobaculia bacterium]
MLKRLAYEHSVERITVMSGQTGKASYGGFVKWQRLNSVKLPLNG